MDNVDNECVDQQVDVKPGAGAPAPSTVRANGAKLCPEKGLEEDPESSMDDLPDLNECSTDSSWEATPSSSEPETETEPASMSDLPDLVDESSSA